MIIGATVGTALCGALGLGVGAILRNQVGAIVGSLVYLFVLENLLQIIPGLDDIIAKYGLGGLSNGLFGADPDSTSDVLGQVPAGLLLAAYCGDPRDHRHPRDAAAGRHGVMHLRPPPSRTPQAAADLVIAGDIAEVGEADYTLEDLRDEWARARLRARDATRWSSRTTQARSSAAPHFRGSDLLAVGRPGPRGRGLRHRAARVGASARAGARRRPAAPGASATAAHARARCSRRTATQRVRSYWRMVERDRADESADEPGLASRSRADGRARAVRDHEPRFSARRRLRAAEPRRTWTAARVQRARPRPRPQPHRRAGQGLRARPPLASTTSLYVDAARRRTPTTRARASAARCCSAVFAAADAAGTARPCSTSPPTTRTRCASTSASA